jgi:calcium permeable stress-gated cation channel
MQRRDLVYYTAVRRAHRLASSPENFTLLLMDLPRDLRDDAALFRFFDDRLFPEQVAAAHVVRDAASLLKLRNRYVAAYTQREAALIADEAAEKDGAPQMVKVRGDRVPAAVHYAEVEEAVFGEAADARGRLDETAPITAAAFVTFRTRHAAAAAAGVPMMLGVKAMRAPEPRAVLWDRLHVTKKTAAIRKTVVTTLVLVMALFWFVPISAIALLSNLEELGKQNGLEWIANFRQDVPWLAKLVEGFLPPILLLVLNVLVPVFIRLILTRARYPSRALLDCAVLRHHYLFLVLTTFIVSATAGSLLSAIDTIVNNPSVSELVDILSKTIPSQASFFIALSLLQLLLAAATSCLCLGKLLLRPILMAGCGRSERLRRKKSDALSAYPFFKLYAVIGLHGLIATVYSTVAPLCALFVGLSLFLLYCTTKHMAMYSQRSMFEGNGVIFKTAWEHSFVALVLHQVILIGLFGLKKAPILAGLEVALLIFTVLFFGKCRRKYYRIAEVGAMADISVTPNESEGVPPRFDDLYVHPGLQEIADIPVVATQ